MKKILTLAALLASFNLWAADVFIALSSMTQDGNTVQYEGTEVKAKNNTVYIELPSDNIYGTITFYGSSKKEDRFLYIHGSHGTEQDTNRGIVMTSDGASVDFTADDIATVETKPYLVFSTTLDFKFKKFEYTYEGGTPSTEPVLNVSPTEVTLAVTADIPTAEAKIQFTGKNLDAGTYSLNVPNVAGLSASPAEVTVPEGGTLNTEVSLAYTSETDVAPANATISLTIGELTKSVEVHYSADLTPIEKQYAQSLNIEQLVLDEGKGADIQAILTAKGYDYNNIDQLDSLNDEKPNRNYPYLGLKVKKTDAQIGLWLQQGSLLTVRFGNVGADFKVAINGTEGTLTNSLANSTPESANVFDYKANDADTYILFTCNSTKTLVFKQLMIDEPVAAVTLPAQPGQEEIAVTGVTLNESSLYIEAGKTAQLTATVSPADATNKKVTWSSSDETIATVDASGKVSAITPGIAYITVTTEDGGKTAICSVMVTEPSGPVLSSDATLKSLAYDGTSIALEADKYNYNIELPAGTTAVPVVTAEANDAKAVLDIKQAIALPGTANVNVTAEDGETVLHYTVAFTIASDIPIEGNVYAITLDNFNVSDNTYEANISELKAKNYDYIFVELPVEDAEGTITMACTSSNTGRFIYIYKEHGTVKDESRRIAMKNGYADPIEFFASDVLTAGGKYYLVFATKDDYKIKGVQYTLAVPPGPSTDATLKSLRYDGITIPDFSPDKENYEVELPAGTTTIPTVEAETNHEAASVLVTQAESLPGTAKVNVTAEDGTTTKEYKITFTVESGLPVVQSATWENIQGQAVIDQTAKSVTGRVTNGSSLQLTPVFTGKHIVSWTPEEAQDFSSGAVFYTFLSETEESIVYAVSITEAPALSSDATLKSLSVDGYSIAFAPTTYTYEVELKSGTTTVPTVRYEVNDAKATAEKTDATGLPGSTKIVVTAEDGTRLTYTIQFTVAVPMSDLALHEPEVYEAETMYGGYGTPLTIFNGREYEVYYINRDQTGKLLTIATSNIDKTGSISDDSQSTDKKTITRDGWAKISDSNGTGGDSNASAKDEFGNSLRSVKMNSESHELEMHISGYDQFSFYGKDNNQTESKGKHFVVYIDGVQQTRTPSDYAINRFDLTTGEHVIRITAIGGSDSKFCSFSLRVAQEPHTKWLYGNDSTQRVKATDKITPVYYFTKYNSMGETKLVWNGPAADGITLETENSNELGDTLVLTGNANCRAGVYSYDVVSYFQGAETNRVNGHFTVVNQLRALTETDADAYQNEAIDIIQFRYYVFHEEDIIFEWLSEATPAGIETTTSNGIFTIGGTPTETGTFNYRIHVTDGDTIEGRINVRELDLGNNPVLYLYKHNGAYDRDGAFLTLSRKGHNLIARKAKDGLRTADQYAKYKWILISEDADANNEEVLAVIRGGANLPVLNMQAFTYVYEQNADMPNGWGEPDNGSITHEGRFITVQRDDHPIFKTLNAKRGDKIQVIDSISQKGLMPINVYLKGTLCLATSLTRGKDYYSDGEMQTFLHEIPSNMRGGQKYICLPLSLSGGAYLSTQGEALLEAVVQYLTGNASSVAVPTLQITGFAIGDIAATISEANNTIHLEVDRTVYPENVLDLTKVVPTITMASPYTDVTPAATDTVDLSWSHFTAVPYEVTDYINRRVYHVTVHTYTSDGIEEVYSVGEWVNIYDLFGRKLTVTNENIYTLPLPNGIYIIVTETGKTLKITR